MPKHVQSFTRMQGKAVCEMRSSSSGRTAKAKDRAWARIPGRFTSKAIDSGKSGFYGKLALCPPRSTFGIMQWADSTVRILAIRFRATDQHGDKVEPISALRVLGFEGRLLS